MPKKITPTKRKPTRPKRKKPEVIDYHAEPPTYCPSTPYFADITGVPYSVTDEYPAYLLDAPKPSVSWRVWVSQKLTALARWVAP